MGALNNIFSLVFGINLIVVGLVACIAGIVSMIRRDNSCRQLTSIFYIIAGAAAVYFGIVLWRSSFPQWVAPRPRLEPNPNFPTHEAPCYQCALGRFAGCGGQIEKWCLLPLMTQLIVHPETYRLRLFTSATFQHKLSMRGARSPLAGISLLFIHFYSCLIWLSSFFCFLSQSAWTIRN